MSKARNLANLLADGAVDTNELADGAVTSSKLASGAVPSIYDTDTTSTGYFDLPKGTTAERPANPQNGYIRYNTDDNVTEEYRDGSWASLSNAFIAEGGTETTITDGGVTYKVHTFTSSGTFSVLSGSRQVEYLVVAGGGGGGADNAGGGGAGGMQTSQTVVNPGFYSIVVGAGGAGHLGESAGNAGPAAENGSDSIAFSTISIGGGNGASASFKPSSAGGSGGGGEGQEAHFGGSSGTPGQGNSGGTGSNGGGGGGGGKGSPGQNGNVRGSLMGGAGGAGATNNYRTGSPEFYAAGGDGGNQNDNFVQFPRPSGIGGQTNIDGTSKATSGVINTGSGGGGATHTTVSGPGGSGGSGIVIIRYPI